MNFLRCDQKKCVRRIVILAGGLAPLFLVCQSEAAGTSSSAVATSASRIAFLVNNEAVFTKSLNDRLRFIALSMGLPATPENLEKLRSSVIRGMIDEILQRQMALKLGVTVEEKEVQKAIQDIESGNQMKPGGLKALLHNNGIAFDTLYNQVRTNLLWISYIRQKYDRSLAVTPQEIQAFQTRFEKRRSQKQYNLAEIVLYVNGAEDEARVKQQAEQIIGWLFQGTPFPVIARQFSQSPSAAQGGYKGWVPEDDLEQAVQAALEKLTPNTLSHPIRMASGYVILALIDRKEPTSQDLGPAPTSAQIVQMLRGERLERLSRLELATLRKKVPVEIRIP